jgi:hypothetical protein
MNQCALMSPEPIARLSLNLDECDKRGFNTHTPRRGFTLGLETMKTSFLYISLYVAVFTVSVHAQAPALASIPAPAKSSPEPTLSATAFPAVEIVPRNAEDSDVGVFHRPARFAQLVGSVARGAVIRVRGQVVIADSKSCDSKVYYALEPFGYLCGDEAKPSNKPPTTGSLFEPIEGSVLPFEYAMVNTPEEELLPMWDSPSDIIEENPAKRMLSRGDTIALEPKTMQVQGEPYRVSIEGDLVSANHSYKMARFSEWQGTAIDQNTHLPFGWATLRKVGVFDSPRGNKIDTVGYRERVDILEEVVVNDQSWLRIGEGRFVRAKDINKVRIIPRPEETVQNPQWFDVDLGEQVVVAYRGDKPQYATLISSGRPPNTTPRGNYPIWGKVNAVTMKSQPYDDKPYYVHKVPWVLFFQAHNALHGAYWHDRFGVVKSHGCANLSPKDARYLFEWVEPKMPPGWTGLRFWDLTQAPVVRVRNSHLRTPIRQERKIGPPDPEEEAERLAKAEARRALEKQKQAQEQTAPALNATTPSNKPSQKVAPPVNQAGGQEQR